MLHSRPQLLSNNPIVPSRHLICEDAALIDEQKRLLQVPSCRAIHFCFSDFCCVHETWNNTNERKRKTGAANWAQLTQTQQCSSRRRVHALFNGCGEARRGVALTP